MPGINRVLCTSDLYLIMFQLADLFHARKPSLPKSMIHVEKAAYRCIYEIAHNGLPVFAATATLLASIKPIVEGGLNEELIQWLKDAQEVFQPKMSIVGPSHPHSLRQSASGPSTPYTDKPSVTTSLTSSSTSRERTPGPSNATGQDAECYSPASSHVRLLKSNPPTPAAARGARRSSRAQAKPQTPATSIPTKNRPAIKKQHKPVEVTQPAAKEFRPTRVQAEPGNPPIKNRPSAAEHSDEFDANKHRIITRLTDSDATSFCPATSKTVGQRTSARTKASLIFCTDIQTLHIPVSAPCPSSFPFTMRTSRNGSDTLSKWPKPTYVHLISIMKI